MHDWQSVARVLGVVMNRESYTSGGNVSRTIGHVGRTTQLSFKPIFVLHPQLQSTLSLVAT